VTLTLPLAIPWIAAAVLAFLDGRHRGVAVIAILSLGGCLAALGGLAVAVARDGAVFLVPGGWARGVGITFRADLLGITFAIVSVGVVLAAFLFEVSRGIRTRSFPAIVVFLTAGLVGLFLTGDAFNFYVFFELSMIASFVLAGYGETPRRLRSAMMFTIVNLMGSVLLLIAITSLYHTRGTLDIVQIAVRGNEVTSGVLVTAALLFVSLALKLGLFPFHFWVPPVYRDSTPAVAAMLSGAVANIGSYGLLRLGADMMPLALETGRATLVVLGAASIAYGGLVAISRRQTSETLAYSSIGQAGYILLALSAGGVAGYAAAVIYAITNALNKTLLFLASSLRGRFVGSAFVVGALSVVGLPLSIGFFGKAALFRAAVVQDSVVLALSVIIGAVLSLLYMFRTYQREYWTTEARPGIAVPAATAVVLALALVTLALGAWPDPVLAIGERAATALIVSPF
jgi:multicomponent Na+:H+ antiporter subunit D